MLKKIVSGILSGILVSIGGAVFLSCENRVVGAVLFSVALLSICFMGYSLYTGKVGFMAEKHGKEEWSILLWGLLGNLIGTLFCGLILKFAVPSMRETANTVCQAKLTQPWYGTLVRGAFCGMLMYLAVAIYRNHKSPLGILFGIPVFILSGFEHSIADMFYFACSDQYSLKTLLFIVLVVLGNSAGALLLCAMTVFIREKAKPSEEAGQK